GALPLRRSSFTTKSAPSARTTSSRITAATALEESSSGYSASGAGCGSSSSSGASGSGSSPRQAVRSAVQTGQVVSILPTWQRSRQLHRGGASSSGSASSSPTRAAKSAASTRFKK